MSAFYESDKIGYTYNTICLLYQRTAQNLPVNTSCKEYIVAAKRSTKSKPAPGRKATGSFWKNLSLTLTLVPLIVGFLLVGAWLLDIILWESPDTQIVIAILFILVSFAASNAIQGHWILATGWALLTLSDLMVLTWINLWAQIAAFVFGAAGLGFLGFEFFRRWRQQKQDKPKKS